MSNIVPFLPKPTVKRQEALDALVTHYSASMHKPLDNPVDSRFKQLVWGAFRWHGIGRFLKIELSATLGATAKSLPPNLALPDKTWSEIQALVIHLVLMNPNASRAFFNKTLRSLLLIETVLRKRSVNGIANFADLKASDLDNASQLSFESSKKKIPATIGPGQRLLIEVGVVTSGSVKNWVDSAKNQYDSDYNTKNRSLDSAPNEKLPDMQAVKAAADYFSGQPWLTRGEDPTGFDEDQRNIVISSVLTVLSLTPCRIEELAKNLPVNCLIRQPENNVGEVLGINWYADKTDMSSIKWVPYTLSGVFEAAIEEAITRLEYLTEGARSLLRSWDSECPEYDEAEYLKAKRENRLPKGWPYFEPALRLRYSDAMFVCFRHQMHPINHTIKNRIDWITKDNLRDWLRTKSSKNAWTGEPTTLKGFFDRIGYEDLALVPDDYNTHAFRHMVNTAARLGGMSEFDVNIWSHRKRRGQGEVYNHTTGEQRRNLILHGNHKAKELTPEERLNHINHGMPMTRQNLGMRFELIGNSYGGFTFNHPLGTCIHNYVEGPCMRSMDCVMCPENAHCKGDKRTLKNLREELEDSNAFLEMAIKEEDRRGEHRFQMRSEVLKSLVEVLGDNSPLADGDLVVLSPHQAPKAGLLERARLAADQIKKNQLEIENRHAKAKSEIGVTRSLPALDPVPSYSVSSDVPEVDSVIDDLMFGFEDDD
ncbi:hypothetical protein ACTXGQ_14905 [Marinobacter sp. 1Y8]